jgi:dehydrogenase/reductase SDR family protein 7B
VRFGDAVNSLFKDQVVWITGASSGIGEAMARDFVKRGARVILTARRADRLEKLARDLNHSSLVAKVLIADLAQLETLPALAQQAIACFGQVDVLFNNAGMSQRSLVVDTPFAIEQHLITVDLLSPIALTKAILPHFTAREKGHFLITSSLMGELELPGNATYACVKHGLNGYFYSMAFEVEKWGCKVQILEPGFVRTEVSESSITASGQLYGKMDSTQANAMSAEEFSRRIFPQIESGRICCRIAGKEGLAIPFKRWFPGLYRMLVKKMGKTLLKDRLESS